MEGRINAKLLHQRSGGRLTERAASALQTEKRRGPRSLEGVQTSLLSDVNYALRIRTGGPGPWNLTGLSVILTPNGILYSTRQGETTSVGFMRQLVGAELKVIFFLLCPASLQKTQILRKAARARKRKHTRPGRAAASRGSPLETGPLSVCRVLRQSNLHSSPRSVKLAACTFEFLYSLIKWWLITALFPIMFWTCQCVGEN